MTIKTELEKEFQSCNIDKIKILLNHILQNTVTIMIVFLTYVIIIS